MPAGLLFLAGLVLNRTDPSSDTGPAETFSYWQDNHGQHQIVGLIVVPLVALLLLIFGAGLKRRLEQGGGDSGHGSVAFGGSILAAATFALVGMLEAGMTNAAHEEERQAVGFMLVPLRLIVVGIARPPRDHLSRTGRKLT